MALTGLRAGSLIRFTKRMRPVGPVGWSPVGASFVPQPTVRPTAAPRATSLTRERFIPVEKKCMGGPSGRRAAGRKGRGLRRIGERGECRIRVGVAIADCVWQPAALAVV